MAEKKIKVTTDFPVEPVMDFAVRCKRRYQAVQRAIEQGEVNYACVFATKNCVGLKVVVLDGASSTFASECREKDAIKKKKLKNISK